MKVKELLRKAWLFRCQESYKQAEKVLAEAEKQCSPNDFQTLGRIYHIYAHCASDLEELDRALFLENQSLEYYTETGDRRLIAHATRHIADYLRRLNEDEQAKKRYEEAIAIYREDERGNTNDMANALRGYGLVLEKLDDRHLAISVWQEVKTLYAACNIAAGVKEAQEKLISFEKQ